MPRRKSAKKRRRKRPYTRTKRAHKIRRRRRHHHGEMLKEAETMNYVLHQMLKTMSQPAGEYNYHPRHHSKDLEYRHSSDRTKQFKRGFPAPDVNFWRPSGPADSDTWTGAPYRGNIA